MHSYLGVSSGDQCKHTGKLLFYRNVVWTNIMSSLFCSIWPGSVEYLGQVRSNVISVCIVIKMFIGISGIIRILLFMTLTPLSSSHLKLWSFYLLDAAQKILKTNQTEASFSIDLKRVSLLRVVLSRYWISYRPVDSGPKLEFL